MPDAWPALVRWLDLGGAASVLGLLLLPLLATRGTMAAARGAPTPVRDAALVACWCVTLAAGVADQWLRAAAAAGDPALTLAPATFAVFSIDTHAGRVWTARWMLLALALLISTARARHAPLAAGQWRWVPLLLIATAQALTALASHAIGTDSPTLDVTTQALHVLAASLWLGGVLALALSTLQGARAVQVPELLARFSPIALLAMATTVATGVLSAVNQLDRWPPLFGTPFGHWLLVKIACLLLALACAAVLRWHWLPRRRDPTRLSTMQRWLSIEALAALIVAGCASALALTPPGRHAAIDWPFPFRLAWTVAWQQPSAREATWTGIGILAAAAVLGALAFRCGHRSLSALLGVVACGATAWVALPPLSVDAQPVTYRVSTVAYDAASIASGRRLFVAHCAGCHGHDADGRGPAAGGLARPPADLTAPHAGDHTPGDLYGWVSDGIRGGVMPAFAGQLQEDERWDVVNYLHTLAGAYQARVIQPRVAQGNPWLGAPGFAYETVDGQRGSLRDWRGSTAVLLILDTGPASAARLQRVAAALPALRAEGVTVLRMPLRDSAGEPSTLAGIVTLRTDPDVAFTYQQYRHTLERLRASESGPLPGHLEFLIDRFGYLRARWITEDTQPGWDDLPQLLEQLRGLRAEPRLKPSPDDHLH